MPSLVHGGHCCGWRSLGSGLPLGTLIVSLRSCWVLGGYWQEVRQETDGPRLSLPHQARETLILDRGYSSPDLTIFSLMPLKIKFTYCILKLSLRQENRESVLTRIRASKGKNRRENTNLSKKVILYQSTFLIVQISSLERPIKQWSILSHHTFSYFPIQSLLALSCATSPSATAY